MDSVQTERRNLQTNTSNGKLNLPFEEKTQLKKKKTIETENDVEIKYCEKGSSEIALYESQRELESQRMQLHQPNQWPDQAQREKINLR